MSTTLKIAIILMTAAGDGVAMVFVSRKLMREGKSELIPIIGGACVMGIIAMAVVLFLLF